MAWLATGIESRPKDGRARDQLLANMTHRTRKITTQSAVHHYPQPSNEPLRMPIPRQPTALSFPDLCLFSADLTGRL
jgi:hypothetical protein